MRLDGRFDGLVDDGLVDDGLFDDGLFDDGLFRIIHDWDDNFVFAVIKIFYSGRSRGIQ